LVIFEKRVENDEGHDCEGGEDESEEGGE
jgi:hypothetical protein